MSVESSNLPSSLRTFRTCRKIQARTERDHQDEQFQKQHCSAFESLFIQRSIPRSGNGCTTNAVCSQEAKYLTQPARYGESQLRKWSCFSLVAFAPANRTSHMNKTAVRTQCIDVCLEPVTRVPTRALIHHLFQTNPAITQQCATRTTTHHSQVSPPCTTTHPLFIIRNAHPTRPRTRPGGALSPNIPTMSCRNR